MPLRSTDIPLVYFTDCLLATVDNLAMLSRPPQKEILRHERIIQRSLNTICALGMTPSGRPQRALEAGGVSAWISRYNKVPELDVGDVGQAADERIMIQELMEFVSGILENPSAKLSGAGEQRRHQSILDTMTHHCKIEDLSAARRQNDERRQDDDSLGF